MLNFKDKRASNDFRKALIPFFILFAVEASVFYGQLAIQITPFYPMNFDQAGYIDQVYTLYLSFVDRGWPSLFKFPFLLTNDGGPSIGAGTGVGLLIQGTLAAIVGGPSRTSLLTLNLIYFYALQICLFAAIGSRTQNTNYSWEGVALLISCISIFNPAGGIFDFRFDFSTFCLYGIWTSLIVWSRTFRDIRLSYAAAAIAALLIIDRYIAAIFVATTLVGVFVVLLIGSSCSSPLAAGLARFRIRNMIVSSLLTFVLGIPFLIPATMPFFQKYVGGHIEGGEKYMRASEVGVQSLTDHILFYPNSIVWMHLGTLTLSLAAVFIFIVFLVVVTNRISITTLWRQLLRYRYELAALIVATILPQIILALDIAKSTVVGGIVIGPIILAFVLLVAGLWPRIQLAPVLGMQRILAASERLSRFIPRNFSQSASSNYDLLTGITATTVVVAVFGFLAHSSTRQHLYPVVELDRIKDLNTKIVRYALENEIDHPQFSTDRIVDYLNPSTIRIAAFERFGAALPIKNGLGFDAVYSLGAVPRDVAMQYAEKSDVLVLTDPDIQRDTPYPFNAAIKVYWADLMTWANKNRDTLPPTTILGVPYHIFVKPQVRVQGVSGGWITNAGMTIEANRNQLSRWPFVVLSGQANFEILGGVPHVRAVVIDSSTRQQVELPALLKSDGYRYELTIDTRSRASTPSGPLEILVTFDRSFVPKDLGINADTRHLVMFAPASRELRAKAPD